tara:strand:+ start:1518 stop:1625 length:108 start_codon:yes stop_codon:yes gene_type:complete
MTDKEYLKKMQSKEYKRIKDHLERLKKLHEESKGK